MSSLKRTTYKALTNEAQVALRTNWYSVNKMTKAPGEAPSAFLGRWIPGSMTTVFYDKTVGELATNIFNAAKEKTRHTPPTNEQQVFSKTYKMPLNSFQCDKIELEMEDGELVDVHIYHTPSMAAFAWEVNGMFHNGFAITTGYTVVLLKGDIEWV